MDVTLPYHILYVDDEPDMLEIGKVNLEEKGLFSVDTQTSAPAGLTLFRSGSYDAIISDYRMPGMDGIEFLKQVRASGSTVPFILFTGKGREEVVIPAFNEGADFYLQKGGEAESQFAELSNKVRYAILRRRAEEDLRISERKFAAAFDASPDPMAITDAGTGKILDINTAFVEWSGYDREELTGKTTRDMDFWVYPEERDAIIQAIMTGSTVRKREVTVRKKTGEIRTILFSASLIDSSDTPYMLSAAEDITGQKREEEQRIR